MMKTLKAFKLHSIFSLFLLFFSFNSFGLNRYWVGTLNNNWNSPFNWSNVSGGGNNFSVPGTNDVAIFDGGSGVNCTINTTASPGTLTITSGYTGTITHSAQLNIGAGGASLSGGTFTGGSSAINCSGAFTISGTAFTSASGTFTCVGNFTFSSGSFTHNSGTVTFNTSNTITGSTTFYNLTFATNVGNTPTFSIAGGTVLTATNTLTLSTTNAITINTGEIDAQGNITVTNTASGGGGSALIKINGTGSQTLTGSGVAGTGLLPKIEIDKSSGTLTLASTISLGNDWTYTQGTVSLGTGTPPTVVGAASLNLDCQGSGGTMSFYDYTVYGGTTTLTGNVNITHDITINSSRTLDGGSKTIFLDGRWTNNGTFTVSTSTIQLQGTALQTVNTSSSTETFYNLIMNKTSGKVLLNDPLLISNNVTFTEGIIKASSTNYFKVLNDATASGGNDSAFVYGYYKKVGDEAFTFALGDTSISTGGYHPLSISAPSSSTDAYTAQYFNTGQSQGSARDSILNYLSTCEHWNLARDAGSSAVTVKLAWNTSSCNIDSLVDLRVAYWNGSKWKDKGGSYTGNTTIGDVVTSSTQSSFGYFIIAKKWPDAYAGADVTICNGGSTSLSGSGNGSSYSWSPSTGLSCTTCTNPTASTTSTITYTYTVTYATGWQSSDNVIVTVNTPATASAGSNQTICSTSTVSLTGSRGGSASSSTWTTSGSGTFANASLTSTTYTPSAGDISGGSVTLTITTDDPAGPCPAASSNMTVTINPAATASAGSNQNICSGSTVSLSGSRGGSATSSTWTTSGSGSFANATLTSTTYTPSAGDIAAGTVTLTITTDDPSGPCPAATANMTVTIYSNPTASAGPDRTIYYSKSVTIGGSPSASGGSSPYTYSWSPSTALSSPSVANPVASPTTTTTYVLLVTDNHGCTKRDTMTVTVVPNHYVNTIGLDSLLWPDTLKYTLNGGGISGKYLAGTLRSFNVTLPAGSTPLTMKLNFLSQDTLIDTLFIIYNIDSSAAISNVRILERTPDNYFVKDTFALDSTFYSIDLPDTINFFDKLIQVYLVNQYALSNGTLHSKMDAGYFDASGGWLPFEYDEKFTELGNYLIFNIYDEDNEVVASDSLNNINFPVYYRYNNYNFDLFTMNVRTAGYYLLEVIAKNDERFYLRFKY